MSSDQELKQLKLSIKTWESDFTKSHQRKPLKEDIQNATSEIKETYKKYWALKNKIENEKYNKEDVWSEKFNKSYNEKKTAYSPEKVFEKYCNKIRERSSLNQVQMKCVLPKKDLGELSNTSKKAGGDVCNLNTSDTASYNEADLTQMKCVLPKKDLGELSNTSKKADSDVCNLNTSNTASYNEADFSNLETEFKITKPVKKIVKMNSVAKKFKSVNILSSAVDFRNLERKMSFETTVDSEWLERCYSDTKNNSHNKDKVTEIPISNENGLAAFRDPENFSSEKYKENNLVCSIVNNISDHSNNVSCSENYTQIFSSSENRSDSNNYIHRDNISEIFSREAHSHPIGVSRKENSSEVSFEKNSGIAEKTSVRCDTNVFDFTENSVNLKNTVNEQSFKSQSLLENEVEPNTEDSKQSSKRKLSKICMKNPKVSSHLERKIASGTLNENFVRVNIKKKKFSRGHRSVNVRKLKWTKWKQMKKFNNSDVNMTSPSSCFKCGQPGHWARNCKVLINNNKEPEEDMEDVDDTPLPTLEEAAELAKKSKINLLKSKSTNIHPNPDPLNTVLLDDTLKNIESIETDTVKETIKPLYEATFDGKTIETPAEVFDSLKELGYPNFRKGQEAAVMRILSGLSTLVVLPTGSGKSLCYQLPAYIYSKQFKCIALVISPLVSLMEDQVTGLPSCLHAICLHSGMTDIQKKTAMQDLNDGKAQILLVSPEAVIGGLKYGSSMLPSNLPPISFACIDEVHCLSQWSHNFRPSYLQLYKALTEHYNVKCILGLTATANQSTAKEIISHLGLKSIQESVIGSTGIPENLHLSVSRDKDRDKALIQLLLGDRFSSCSSIIIYCIRRDETERLATLIRTLLQDETSSEPPAKKTKSKSKKRNFLWTAEAYHAGLAPPRRRSIQKQFMTGKLRVIVATIAFGMGLDKRDVRAIIHYNMPKSFESYVQEIGRAGRDGLDSHCHLFLDNEGKDMRELQRFIFSNSTDRYVIRKLLKKVFPPCQCKAYATEKNPSAEDAGLQNGGPCQNKCLKHEIAFPINETVQELDLKEENILTLLCYLELHSKKWIEVLPPTYATCTIRCYGGPKQLKALALKNPVVAAAFALDAKKNKNLQNMSSYEFAVVDVASSMGWNAGSVKRSLKNLEWNDQNRKTGAIVDFSDLAFHLRSPGDLSDDELDDILDFLYQKVILSEKKELLNLKSLHSIFSKYSYPHYWACSEEAPASSSQGIKNAVNKYFDESAEDLELQGDEEDNANIDLEDIRSQIRDIIYTNNDQNFTGRAVARIFHGIGSPCFPAEVWGRVRKFWRCLLDINFNLLVKLANEELKKAK